MAHERLLPSTLRLLNLVLVTSAGLAGCAAGPHLQNYPRREIDRPYTLPSGVAAWHVPTAFGYVRDRASSTTILPIPVPLIWETPVSEDWSLFWFPLPLGVLHQLSQTETSRTGFSALTGFSYDSDSGFRLRPNLLFSHRRILSRSVALDIEPFFAPNIPFKRGERFEWSAGVSSGPVIQLADAFALAPSVSVGAARGAVPTPPGTFEDHLQTDAEKTGLLLGLGVSAHWSIARQWDLHPLYRYSRLGSDGDRREHVGIVEFVHFW